MTIICTFFLWSEVARWWRGSETHTFAVEKGVSHQMQINLDIVVHMQCTDLHVNVQDASGDRIHAANKLQRDRTAWDQWVDAKGIHKLGRDSNGRVNTGAGWKSLAHLEEGFGEEHVHDIVALGKKTAKWAKTPRTKGAPDSCRIYGSLELNKVQGDFHITARGHGYRQAGQHLDHNSKKFPNDYILPANELQSSTSPTSSPSCRTAPSTPRLSTRSTARSTQPRPTSTCSSTTCPWCRPSIALAAAPLSRTSTP